MKEIALHILDVAENCIAAEADYVLISVKQERAWSVSDRNRG